MKLIEEKESLVLELYNLSEELNYATKNNQIEKIEEILGKRENIMKRIDVLDNSSIEENGSKIASEEIKKRINAIILMDKETNGYMAKKYREMKQGYENIEERLQTGNLEVDSESVKPTGYFLNTKS